MLRVRGGVRAGAADPVDLHPYTNELAGGKARPGGIRPHREGHAAVGLAADVEDAGAGVTNRDLRPDQLEVAIDSVRADQQIDKPGAKQTTSGSQGWHSSVSWLEEGFRRK